MNEERNERKTIRVLGAELRLSVLFVSFMLVTTPALATVIWGRFTGNADQVLHVIFISMGFTWLLLIPYMLYGSFRIMRFMYRDAMMLAEPKEDDEIVIVITRLYYMVAITVMSMVLLMAILSLVRFYG